MAHLTLEPENNAETSWIRWARLARNTQISVERIRSHLVAVERDQSLCAVVEMHGPGSHHHPDRARRPDHRKAFKAPLTAAIIDDPRLIFGRPIPPPPRAR